MVGVSPTINLVGETPTKEPAVSPTIHLVGETNQGTTTIHLVGETPTKGTNQGHRPWTPTKEIPVYSLQR